MKSMIVAAVALCLSAGSAGAQQTVSPEAGPPTVESIALLETNTRSMGLDDALSGEGADFLREQTQDVQFVLMGEYHDDRDTPRFASALFGGLSAWHGFDTVVVEVDPVAVETLSQPPYRGDVEAMAGLARRYPTHIGFASDQDLAFMAQTTGEADLWGIEQVQGAQPLLEALEDLVPNDGARAQVEALLTEVRTIEAGRDQFGAFLYLDAETLPRLEALTTAFAAAPASRAAFLLSSLTDSAEIYSYARRAVAGEPVGLFNNTARETLLKRHFLRQYRAAEAEGRKPRAMFKMGAWHMYHGRNPGQAFSVGNFAHEFAIANGAEAYGLFVVPIGGQFPSLADLPSWMVPVLSSTNPDQAVVIDLRALRPTAGLFTAQVPLADRPQLRDLIHGFDALVLLPNSDTATWTRTGFPSR